MEKSVDIIESNGNDTTPRSGRISRDTGIVVGVSIVSSVVALLVFAMTLPT